MMKRRFQQVDVFGAQPYDGNPLAVIFDAEDLSGEEMQRFTRWANLSECTFLLPPSSPAADYRVRIFTLAQELPFAGHPTLGSAHAWLTAGGQPRQPRMVTQECGVGLVPLRRGVDQLAFAAPPLLRSGPVDEDLLEGIVQVLGVDREKIVDCQWVSNGPKWIGILCRDAATVLAAEPDFRRCTDFGSLELGLVGPYPPGSECAFEVRALFSDQRGVLCEDPATGSLNASLAQWLLGSGRATAPYTTSQGTRLGRRGRPRISQDADGTIWLGGSTFTCVEGHVNI